MNVKYKHNTATREDILNHLQQVAFLFVDNLSNRVDLELYSNKIATLAEREEAWLGSVLVGLVAYYINQDSKESYITNVSIIEKYQGKGIATELINRAKKNAFIKSMTQMRLEVAKNERLLQFYQNNGFVKVEQYSINNLELVTGLLPLVAIRCTVYNHEPYLRDCLEGFIMQQTNFPFVAIVHDDASTDGSAAIIREFEEKYPDIIKPIYETKNQYSKKDGSLQRIMNEAIGATGAKYVAMCEGDDYWTDPLKLQKQVDFLEANPNYTMCYTNYSNVDKNNLPIIWTNREANIKRSKTGDIFAELLKGNFIQTCTILYRDSICRDPLYLGGLDYACVLQNAMMGECVFIKDTTACYRLQPNSLIHTQNDIIKQVSMDIWCRYVICYLNQKKYKKSAISHIQVMSVISSKLISMLRTKSSNDKEMAKTIMHTHPIINFYLPFGIAIRMFNVIRKNLVRK